MVNKNQLLNAIHKYISTDMLPKAQGNYKVILNIARAAISMKPDLVFNAVAGNSLVTMLELIDEQGNVDLDTLVEVLSDGLGSDEFTFGFHLLGKDYTFYLSAGDIRAIKSYIE